jgi:hypothetical protein
MTGRASGGMRRPRSWPRAFERPTDPRYTRWCIVVVAVMVVAGLPARAMAAPPREVAVGPNLPVTATDLRVAQANNSPALAEDPTEPRFVALASRLDSPDFACALHLSGDGGRHWVPAQPVAELPAGAEKCYAPELAFDRKGTLYYLFVGLQGLGNSPMGAFLTTSSDRGRSFSSPQRIVGTDKTPILGAHNYMVRMAIDPTIGPRGRIHLVWLHAVRPPGTGGLPAEGNPILASHSDDAGQTFSQPVQVSDSERRRAVAPALAIGADRAVHVAYYDLQDDAVDYQGLEGPTWDGNWSLVVSTSLDGGQRFGRGVEVEGRVVPPGRVMLIFTMPPPALTARQERVYAAWPDARHGDPDIFLSRSSDGGRSWERPQRLNDDPAGNRAHQSLARLSVAPGGRVDAVFYDRREDPTNLSSHVYYAFSVDHGRRFSPNARLTSRPSDSRIGRTYSSIRSAQGLVELGSRLGLLSRRSGVVAAWPDARNGTVGGGQDIVSTEVMLAEGRGTSDAVFWVVGVGLVVGGVVTALSWRFRRKVVRASQPPPQNDEMLTQALSEAGGDTDATVSGPHH